jgi:DNA-binding response OmpR family regulator
MRPTRQSIEVDIDLEETRLTPTLLLLSDDEGLADLVRGIVKRPWRLVRLGADDYMSHKVFTQPNVRLAILDDQAVEENERGWMLTQIRKHFSGIPLLYIAGRQSDANEKRARTNGAQYYVSKPLSVERFGQVLRSFLQAQQVDGPTTNPAEAKSMLTAEESSVKNPVRIDMEIRSLSEELNREDSQLSSRLLDMALAGLRLERNPESLELRRDAAKLWVSIEPILSHHLDAEDKELLPWLEQQGARAPDAGRKIRAYHDRLRTLIGAIANAAADRLTEAQAREIGRALSGLAVTLDDAIDDEERRLFPTIQKALFGIYRRA